MSAETVTTDATQAVAPDCPRCLTRPLRLDRCERGNRWHCSNPRCRYETTRDRVVEQLLRELRHTRDLLDRYARLSLPGYIRDTFGSDHRCPECETKWREALATALEGSALREADAPRGVGAVELTPEQKKELGL